MWTLVVVIADVVVVRVAVGAAGTVGVGVSTRIGVRTTIAIVHDAVAVLVGEWAAAAIGIGVSAIGRLRTSIVHISHAIAICISRAFPFTFPFSLTLPLSSAITITIAFTITITITITPPPLAPPLAIAIVTRTRPEHDRQTSRPELRVAARFVRVEEVPVSRNGAEPEPRCDHELEAEPRIEIDAPSIRRPSRTDVRVDEEAPDTADARLESQTGRRREELSVSSRAREPPTRERDLNRERIDDRHAESPCSLQRREEPERLRLEWRKHRPARELTANRDALRMRARCEADRRSDCGNADEMRTHAVATRTDRP
jgi:hypothetical protein